MKQIEIRPNGTKRVFTINEEPSRTDSSWKDEVNVNSIIDRIKKTGQVTHLTNKQGTFADVTQIPDLQTALNQVTQANQAFDELPAYLRERFSNNPVEMIKFLQNESNRDEAIKLGLIPTPPSKSELTPKSEPTPTTKTSKSKTSNDDD